VSTSSIRLKEVSDQQRPKKKREKEMKKKEEMREGKGRKVFSQRAAAVVECRECRKERKEGGEAEILWRSSRLYCGPQYALLISTFVRR
jgi:hypothetical protein